MSIYGNPVMMGGSGGGGGSTNILSGTQSPTSLQGTNGVIYLKYGSILGVNSFTKLYSTSIPFGTNGSSVAARLAINDETSHSNLQAGGWYASGMAYYDSEDQIGAYAGYSFGEPLSLSKIKLWLGRYSGQNTTLYATVQYLDNNGDWHDVETLSISPSISYPSCIFEVDLDPSVSMYGVRWIHKDSPNKYGGNNITFAGMTVYGNTNGAITNAFAKVEGSWQNLIGTDINDIDLGGGGTIVPKTITTNGTYNASADNADGYDPVVVNVSGSASAFTNVEPLHVNVNNGYLASPSQFSYEENSPCRYDVYPVYKGKHYLGYLGATVSNRFRLAYFAEDPATFTTNVDGGGAYFYSDQPVPYMVAGTANHMLTPEYDGYLMIQKTNQSLDTIKTYVAEYVEP